MSSYAETNGTNLLLYPYTFTDLQTDNPYTDFGINTDVMFWYPQTQKAKDTGNSLKLVEVLEAPIINPVEQYCIPKSTPELVDGKWVIGWEVLDKTTEQKQQELSDRRLNMSCTPFQGKAALFQAGILDSVESLIANTSTDTLTKLAWTNATEWKRLSPMIVSLATALSLSETEVDNLFTEAAKVTA